MTPDNNFREVPLDVIERDEAANECFGKTRGVRGLLRVFSTADARAQPLRGYYVKGLLYENELVVFYGLSSTGKSFLVAYLMWAIAQGVAAVFGMRVRQADVLYCALEGGGGFHNRVVGMIEDLRDAPKFHYVTEGVDLTDEGRFAEIVEIIRKRHIKIFVLDTVARALGQLDEIRDVGIFIALADRLRELTGVTVILIAHEGKEPGRGPRGSSRFVRDPDTVVHVDGTENPRTVKIEKLKDGVAGRTFSFELKPVKTGVDEDEEEITTCTVKELSSAVGAAKATKAARRTPGDVQALRWLREAETEYPEPPPPDLPKSIMRVTTIAHWRAIGRKRGGKKDDHTVWQAVDRAITNLEPKGVIAVRDGFVWTLPP